MHIAASSPDVLVAVAYAVTDRLSEPDAAALNLLHDNPGMSVGDLAADLGLSHSATVRVVDRLESAGLARRSSAGEGRRLAVALTAQGRRRHRAAARRRDDTLETAMSVLDDGERATLIALLQRVACALAPDASTADRACRRCDQARCLAAGCPLPR